MMVAMVMSLMMAMIRSLTILMMILMMMLLVISKSLLMCSWPEPGHRCYFTVRGQGPSSGRVMKQVNKAAGGKE